MKKTFIIVTAFLVSNIAFSQKSMRDTCITIPQFYAAYSYQIPGGDLADRFGASSSIGGGYTHKTHKNWLFGVEADYIFGTNVLESSIFDSIKTSNGEIINMNGVYSIYAMSERGFYIGGKLGKIIPVFKHHPNSGIMLTLSGGLLQHKIRIDQNGNNTPQINDEYKKGYDRLTNGFCIREFVGYQHLGHRKIVNFFIGVELSQAWTQNRRSFNFDTMVQDTKQRLDLIYSIKAGWIIPVYRKAPAEYYIN